MIETVVKMTTPVTVCLYYSTYRRTQTLGTKIGLPKPPLNPDVGVEVGKGFEDTKKCQTVETEDFYRTLFV